MECSFKQKVCMNGISLYEMRLGLCSLMKSIS